MPKRKRTTKSVKATKSVPVLVPVLVPVDPAIETLQQALEQQIAAVRAVRGVQIENLLTELRLLRSLFTNEQLQKPLLQVFQETLQNLSVSVAGDGDGKKFDVTWKHKHNCVDGRRHVDVIIGRTDFLGADNLPAEDVVFEDLSERTIAMQALHTPVVSGQMLPVGMTPKTLRQPKPGEMLLSVHGSPLGVYKENNMEAIQESEEG